MNSSIFSIVSPVTGEQIETSLFFAAQETEAALACADKSFKSYRKLSGHKRVKLLSTLAATLRQNQAHLAKAIRMEMGKTLPEAEAEAEVEKCAWEADWYPEHGPQMFANMPAPAGKVEAYVSYLPLGPIAASDPRVPAGGVKNSRYGRELSHFGLRTFVNAQTAWIDNS